MNREALEVVPVFAWKFSWCVSQLCGAGNEALAFDAFNFRCRNETAAADDDAGDATFAERTAHALGMQCQRPATCVGVNGGRGSVTEIAPETSPVRFCIFNFGM